DTKLVGKPEILAADFEGRIFRPEKAKRQRDPCIVGIVDAAQADRLLARVRYLGEMRLSRLRQRFYGAMDELRPDARLVQPVDGSVAVLRRPVAMAPFIN